MGGLWLLRGEDHVLLSKALADLLHERTAGGDRALMVTEFEGDDYDLGSVVDAAQTAPFLTDSRIVVAREIGRFNTEQAAGLVAYVADPLPTTDLILTATSGRIPKALLDAVKKNGGQQIGTDPPTKTRDRDGWFTEQFAAAGLRLDSAARTLVVEQLGEDVGRLAILLETLAASYGDGAQITADQVQPFLGEGGGVPPWELTDAIDRGDTAVALERLHRMIHGGERHPLQLMATLHAHYTRMMRLDGTEARDEKSAAEVLGIKGSTFPARKALDQSRRLGSTGITRAITMMAEADGDLRGERDWEPELVMEVLVARLSKLAPARRR
ncbi:MAG: holA [Acidimicrobiia bacterium]|nr:holA [Acidimicrobiia bacterium]